MEDTLTELRGLKYIDGRIVQVGKASQEKDHGKTFWLCQSQPPHSQKFQPAADSDEAIAWLRTECGAEEVLEGLTVPEPSSMAM